MKSFRQNPNIPALLRRALLSWMTAVTAEYLLLPGHCRQLDGLGGPERMSGSRVTVVFLLVFSALSFFSRKFIRHNRKNPYDWGILLSFAVLAGTSLLHSFTPAFSAACFLLFFRLLFDCCHMPSYGALTFHDRKAGHAKKTSKNAALRKTRRFSEIPRGNKKTSGIFLWITAALSALFFLFVSVWTVSRVYCFSTPTYDFGIFSQMFHYMKNTGIPYTTLERDGLLSHFHVHLSPVYYLLLPFYCLAPIPATLQVLQAAVITSAVIPLWKLGKHHGLAPFQRMLLCVLLLLYPAFSGGVGYDIHENCFLTPLLLWLFYGIDRKNGRLTAVTSLLTMLVKEDAPVYVACIGLWLLVNSFLHPHNNHHPVRRSRWGIIAGSIMLSASLIYFFAASGYLTVYGDGLMTNRYGNFISETASPFSSLIKTAFLCPMKIVYECADADKLWFIAVTILPLLGLPLLTRRWERYLLLIPYILINLMPDYAYQHDIFFQYVFGSTACLLYLTMINLVDLRQLTKQLRTADIAIAVSPTTTATPTAAFSSTKAAANASSQTTTAFTAFFTTTAALTAATVICAICFAATIVPKAVSYPARCISSREDYQALRRTLSRIPDEASVTASTFYTTFLSQRDILYDIHYASKEHLLSTEFVVLDPASENDFKQYAGNGKTGYEGLVELLTENGYQLHAEISGTVEIYHRKKPS